MKKTTIFLLLIFLLGSCSKEKKCEDFKTGRFKFKSRDVPENVTRNDSIQIEFNPVTGREIHNKIEWTSPCNYILTYQKVLNDTIDHSDLIGEKTYVEILETKGNTLLVKVVSDRIDRRIKMIKL